LCATPKSVSILDPEVEVHGSDSDGYTTAAPTDAT